MVAHALACRCRLQPTERRTEVRRLHAKACATGLTPPHPTAATPSAPIHLPPPPPEPPAFPAAHGTSPPWHYPWRSPRCAETPHTVRAGSGCPGTSRGTPLRTARPDSPAVARRDRKSTRLNSSHLGISYAVFCLKK